MFHKNIVFSLQSDEMAPRTGWNGFVGHSLETPGVGQKNLDDHHY